jgi:hypothetical protein
MLLAISSTVFSDLSSHAPLLALLTNGIDSIRPLIAEFNDGEKFVTYHVKYQKAAAKPVINQYEVVVQSWATDYDQTLAIADEIQNAFGQTANVYEYLSAEPRFNEQGIFYTEQTFSIKK